MKSFSSYNAHIRTLFLAGGFFGFSLAILAFMMAPYLKSVLGTENISILYILPEILVLFFFSFFLKWVGRGGKTVLFFTLIFFQILILASLIFWEGSLWSIPLIVFYFALIPFLMMSLDMFLEAHSSNENAGRVHGLYILCVNLGFLLGPFVAGSLAERFGFASLFFVSLCCYMLMAFLVLFQYRSEQTPRVASGISFLRIIRELSKDRDLISIYGVSVLLEGFFNTTVIAFPLFLLDVGLTLSQIGLIFTVMLLPFVLFAYPAGRLADLKWGEKEMLIGAMMFLGTILLVIAGTTTSELFVWMGLFFLTRVGAALIETMRDTYYYKHMDGDDVTRIAFFRTAYSVGILLSSIVMFTFLYFTHSFRALFVLLACCIFCGIYFAVKIKDTEGVIKS